MLKGLAITAVSAALMFGWPRVSEQQQRSAHVAQDISSRAQRPVPPTHVVIDPPLPAPNSQPPASAKPEEAQENPLPRFIRPEWVIVYVTIAYALIAWLTLGAIARQADSMERAADDARKTAADATATAQSTLDAIEQQTVQLERQVKASHDGLKAWIGVDVKEIKDPESPFVTLYRKLANWEMTNYGQTPAFIKSVSMANAAFDPADPTWNVPRQPRIVYGFLGAGRSEKNLLELSGEALSQFDQGRRIWRVVVRIEYEDVFGQSHETMASFHYYVPKGTADPLRPGFYQDHDPSANYNR